VIGASLGGSMMLAHAVLNPSHAFGALVAIGSPVRWVEVHPLLALACWSPALAGMIRWRGTRKLAGVALPLLVRHAPWVLAPYMNAAITDTRAADEMVKTVEDPNRHVTRQIAEWIHERDLILGGVNIAEGLRAVAAPLLCVSAWADGIVPRPTAEFPYRAVGSPVKRLLTVGSAEHAMAHADPYLSNESQSRVFAPIATWLRERTGGAGARASAEPGRDLGFGLRGG
jgi:fermentation-respiration switch protein FrsA (DUF1100 family)